jgi:hypothetical protein
LIDTSQGAYARVIEVLGRGPTDVPIDDELEPACASLRANAWERLGQLPSAIELLTAFKLAKSGPQRQLLRHFMSSWGALKLCAESEPESERRHQASARARSATRAGRPVLRVAEDVAPQLGAGNLVVVRVDPTDLSSLALEMD